MRLRRVRVSGNFYGSKVMTRLRYNAFNSFSSVPSAGYVQQVLCGNGLTPFTSSEGFANQQWWAAMYGDYLVHRMRYRYRIICDTPPAAGASTYWGAVVYQNRAAYPTSSAGWSTANELPGSQEKWHGLSSTDSRFLIFRGTHVPSVLLAQSKEQYRVIPANAGFTSTTLAPTNPGNQTYSCILINNVSGGSKSFQVEIKWVSTVELRRFIGPASLS